MNEDTVKSFVEFYIETFNNKSRSKEFFVLWKEYSTLVYNNIKNSGQELAIILTEIYNNFILDTTNISLNMMMVGDRRANILITYNLIDKSNNYHRTSQYIQLAYSNDKEYWIHSSLLSIG